ncbi:hypothetical protein ACW9YV_21935 (plasmid) [Paraburkholderia strydomiana]
MKKENVLIPFPLGCTVATAGAIALMRSAGIGPLQLLSRHHCGDWGCVDAEDAASNDRAVREGRRILSAYELGPHREKVWLITEADRSFTTILLPSEY